MPERQISQLGERKLLKTIFKKFASASHGLKVGMGDDAAVVQPRQGWNLVYTTDTLVEKIDFDFGYATYKAVGHKAMAANLSDIAAMGAFPKYFLLTIGIPSKTALSAVLKLFYGAVELAGENQTSLIGGDLSEAPVLTIGITLIGEVRPPLAVLRSTASPGDILFVTGTLGDSSAGLDLLKTNGSFKPVSWRKALARRHLTPLPRLQEGQFLSQKRLATAMMDISDGLYQDILNLTEASGVGAEIQVDDLPISIPLMEYAKIRGINPSLVALSGGEDFELLFSVSPKNLKKMIQLIQSGRIVAKLIGKVTRRKGIRYIDREKKILKIKNKGFEHFTPHV
jgi:thiamine-monophosphate kinase